MLLISYIFINLLYHSSIKNIIYKLLSLISIMTQIFQAEAREDAEIKRILHPLLSEWFFTKFKEFSPTQRYGVMNIWERRNILISAPTGGTKTLTAFLAIINYLVMLA